VNFWKHALAEFTIGACKLGPEGIVSKRLTAPYRSGRSRDWLKVKNPDSPAMVRHREGQDFGGSRMICPVVKYVLSHRVEDHLRLGWMPLRYLHMPRGEYSVLMGWPCKRPVKEPVWQ
jgi:hypothetical protein